MPKHRLPSDVKRLILLGKEKGYLTYDDLNKYLLTETVSSDQLNSLLAVFGEMGINIVATPEGDQYQKIESNSQEAVEDVEEIEKGPEEVEKEIDFTPEDLSRTVDPVRLYLKEMGRVALLSREGEIELAKRIEEGKNELASTVFGLPMTLNHLLSLRYQLKRGKLQTHEIVVSSEAADDDDLEDEVMEQDEEELRQQTLTELDAICKLSKRLMALYARRRRLGCSQVKQYPAEKQFQAIRQQVVDRMEALNLQPALRKQMLKRIKTV